MAALACAAASSMRPPVSCRHQRSTICHHRQPLPALNKKTTTIATTTTTTTSPSAPRSPQSTITRTTTTMMPPLSSWIASSLVAIGTLSIALHAHAADMEFNDRQKEAICGTPDNPKILKTPFARKLCGQVSAEDIRAKEIEAKKLEKQKKLLREKVFAAFS